MKNSVFGATLRLFRTIQAKTLTPLEIKIIVAMLTAKNNQINL